MPVATHPAVKHIRRLKAENLLLRQVIFNERKQRDHMRKFYQKRLKSRFMWLLDYMVIAVKDGK